MLPDARQLYYNAFLVAGLPVSLGLIILAGIHLPQLFIPFGGLVIAAFAWIISRYELHVTLFKVLAFTLPFSVEIPIIGDTMIFMPTEPLIGLAVMTLVIDYLRTPGFIASFRRSELLWFLPLLAAYIITVPFSVLPGVSIKFSIVNVSYLVVFVVFLTKLLRSDPDLFPKLLLFYSAGFIVVLIYALYQYQQFEWNPVVRKGVFHPFYRDHTIFGATAALLTAFWLTYAPTRKMLTSKFFIMALGFICVLAVWISGSRAAMLSLGFFVSVWLLLRLKAGIIHLVLLTIVALMMLFIFRYQIFDTLEQNTYVSHSSDAEWTGNLKSSGNITTDVSNVERMNRWYAGLMMFVEKPVAGFGPGTYQFTYIPYQRKEWMNRLTVSDIWNVPENSGGTAHSEYILLMSEMGLIGFLALLVLLLRLIRIAFMKSGSHVHRRLIIMAFAAISTFLFHAFFNNFLNTDKFAFLFWGTIAWMMVIYEQKDSRSILS